MRFAQRAVPLAIGKTLETGTAMRPIQRPQPIYSFKSRTIFYVQTSYPSIAGKFDSHIFVSYM